MALLDFPATPGAGFSSAPRDGPDRQACCARDAITRYGPALRWGWICSDPTTSSPPCGQGNRPVRDECQFSP